MVSEEYSKGRILVVGLDWWRGRGRGGYSGFLLIVCVSVCSCFLYLSVCVYLSHSLSPPSSPYPSSSLPATLSVSVFPLACMYSDIRPPVCICPLRPFLPPLHPRPFPPSSSLFSFPPLSPVRPCRRCGHQEHVGGEGRGGGGGRASAWGWSECPSVRGCRCRRRRQKDCRLGVVSMLRVG